MVYPSKSIKAGQTFMMFGYFNGIAGNVTTDWVDRNVVPYYKGTTLRSTQSVVTLPAMPLK